MGWAYLEIADYLAVVEKVLGIKVAVSKRNDHLVALAESALAAPAASYEGLDFYPDFARKATVLYSHLARNHPLPDGNKTVAFLCTVEFCERNGYTLSAPTEEDTEVEAFVDLLADVAAGKVSEAEFADWVAAHLSRPQKPGP